MKLYVIVDDCDVLRGYLRAENDCEAKSLFLYWRNRLTLDDVHTRFELFSIRKVAVGRGCPEYEIEE